MTAAGRSPGRVAPALFAHGFRPFFLLAGLQAAVILPLWLAAWMGSDVLPFALPAPVWHGHEMLSGYAGAALAGFLLTAAPNWAGRPALNGAPLMLLAALWLAGRGAMAFGAAAPTLAAALDLLFLPALAVALWPTLRQATPRNRLFLVPIAFLFAADLWMHLAALGIAPGGTVGAAELLAVDIFALLIGVVGGRIVPAFTRNALRAAGHDGAVREGAALDRWSLIALAAIVPADLALPGPIAGLVALAAATLNAVRLAGWGWRHTLADPLLWVLHLGYGWLVIGLAWKGALQVMGFAASSDLLHGLAIGAVGTMTLAVMSRAALGHAGRPLVAPRPVVWSYAMVSLAAISRLIAVFLSGGTAEIVLVLSALAWTGAFGIFLVVYAPILARPRLDGRPG